MFLLLFAQYSIGPVKSDENEKHIVTIFVRMRISTYRKYCQQKQY